MRPPTAAGWRRHAAGGVRRPAAAPLLLLLAFSSSAAFPCSLCDAGYESCGVCLNRVERAECPTSDALDIMANCTGVPVGEMCEADGECGTSTVLNNCENMNWDGASCPSLLRVMVRVGLRPRKAHSKPRPTSSAAAFSRRLLSPSRLHKQRRLPSHRVRARRAARVCRVSCGWLVWPLPQARAL